MNLMRKLCELGEEKLKGEKRTDVVWSLRVERGPVSGSRFGKETFSIFSKALQDLLS
jgi:hypothetical protein